MNSKTQAESAIPWPTLAFFPMPAKVLVTMVIVTMAIAMIGALGQVVLHDIIPTFQELTTSDRSDDHLGFSAKAAMPTGTGNSDGRDDLFSGEITDESRTAPQVFYKTEQFVWTLKWTHIHLFGMNMIFIFLGTITLFLNAPFRIRAWLVGLPFAGVLIDIAAMWLKGYVSQHFFWLHIPGGGLFGAIFSYVSIRALFEMWITKPISS